MACGGGFDADGTDGGDGVLTWEGLALSAPVFRSFWAFLIDFSGTVAFSSSASALFLPFPESAVFFSALFSAFSLLFSAFLFFSAFSFPFLAFLTAWASSSLSRADPCFLLH